MVTNCIENFAEKPVVNCVFQGGWLRIIVEYLAGEGRKMRGGDANLTTASLEREPSFTKHGVSNYFSAVVA